MSGHKLVILACTILALQVVPAYDLYFLKNPGFTGSLDRWWVAFENRDFPVGRGSDEWTSDHNGSCHLTVSGSPCVVAIKQAVGTVVFPGDTVWMRCSKTDLTGFGSMSICLGGADSPFEQYAAAPSQAGDFDVSLVSQYCYPAGSEIQVHLVVWPGSGEAWIDSIWLSRAGEVWVGTKEGGRGQLPARQLQKGRAFPLPTTGPVTMTYDLVRPATAEVSIYDVTGALVARLEARGTTGTNHASWTGVDCLGRDVAAGVYYYNVKAEGSPIASGKVTLTR